MIRLNWDLIYAGAWIPVLVVVGLCFGARRLWQSWRAYRRSVLPPPKWLLVATLVAPLAGCGVNMWEPEEMECVESYKRTVAVILYGDQAVTVWEGGCVKQCAIGQDEPCWRWDGQVWVREDGR